MDRCCIIGSSNLIYRMIINFCVIVYVRLIGLLYCYGMFGCIGILIYNVILQICSILLWEWICLCFIYLSHFLFSCLQCRFVIIISFLMELFHHQNSMFFIFIFIFMLFFICLFIFFMCYLDYCLIFYKDYC